MTASSSLRATDFLDRLDVHALFGISEFVVVKVGIVVVIDVVVCIDGKIVFGFDDAELFFIRVEAIFGLVALVLSIKDFEIGRDTVLALV